MTVVVVADTSPLNYLVQIKCDHLLPAMYERILVPAVVMQELGHVATPASGRGCAWLAEKVSS